MDCPKEDEVMFMRSVLDQGLDALNPLKALYTPHSVLERFRKFGPYLRPVLPTAMDTVMSEGIKQERAFASMTSEALLKAYDISDSVDSTGLSASHYLLRISPVSVPGLAFSSYTLKPSSAKVKQRLGEQLFKSEVANLRTQLAVYDQNPGEATPAMKGSVEKVLETFFVKHAIQKEASWVNWMVATTKFSSKIKTAWKSEWKPFTLNVTEISTLASPTFADIVASPGVIFYMSDEFYPFVDYFWFDPIEKLVNAGSASNQNPAANMRKAS
jgi:hypothetical protein